jgi:hypothetical protein
MHGCAYGDKVIFHEREVLGVVTYFIGHHIREDQVPLTHGEHARPEGELPIVQGDTMVQHLIGSKFVTLRYFLSVHRYLYPLL